MCLKLARLAEFNVMFLQLVPLNFVLYCVLYVLCIVYYCDHGDSRAVLLHVWTKLGTFAVQALIRRGCVMS